MNNELEEAKRMLDQEVFLPALAHRDLSAGVKQAIRQSRLLIKHFREIGDLKFYLSRFSDNANTSKNAQAIHTLGLKTFEDIKTDFLRHFADQVDRFYVDDLVVGDECNSFDISILSQTYNNRAGGILEGPLRNGGISTITKITMNGGRYQNEWLIPNRSIKSYLQARGDIFNEAYVANQLIIANPDRPIHCFTRSTNVGTYTYRGIFSFAGISDEERVGSTPAKWFTFNRIRHMTLESKSKLDQQLELDVSRSSLDTSENRRLRLAKANKIPRKRDAVYASFVRNPDVIAEVLYLAQGSCDACGSVGPFEKRLDDSRYLEVHHKKPLAQGGEDTVENAVALCPNCHRQEHHGKFPRWPTI